MLQQFIAIFFFLFAPFFLTTSLQAQEPTYYGGEAGKKLDWTVFYLNSHYVDSTDAERLTELAIIRMLQELDPFSKYQSKKQLDEQQKADQGIKNDGIGIKYYVINDTATITFIDAEGPSFSAGLLKGDKILAINGTNTVGQNFPFIDAQIIADRGRIINFKIRRNGQIRNISVTSEALFAASLDAGYKIVDNIGYIKLNRFTLKTFGEIEKAITDLKNQGAIHLIIDLRYNRGGVVKGATDLANQFLSDNKLIMSSEGQGFPKNEVFSTNEGFFKKGKVVILTNTSTASASEIFTGAMQEWDRALVMGEVTYGKGLIQQSYLLGDSSAVRLTIGRYYTPTGRILQRPYQYDTQNDWLFQNIANAIYHEGKTIALDPPPGYLWKTKGVRSIVR